MRTNLIRGALALAVVLAVSAPALAQGIIRGKVVDAEGKPIEGAIVTIEGTGGITRKALRQFVTTRYNDLKLIKPVDVGFPAVMKGKKGL